MSVGRNRDFQEIDQRHYFMKNELPQDTEEKMGKYYDESIPSTKLVLK